MKKTKRTTAKKAKRVGRTRTTDVGVQITVCCHASFLKRIDDWQARKAPELSRPQAINELAEIGLRQEEKMETNQQVLDERLKVAEEEIARIVEDARRKEDIVDEERLGKTRERDA
jgi:hypothetical protein